MLRTQVATGAGSGRIDFCTSTAWRATNVGHVGSLFSVGLLELPKAGARWPKKTYKEALIEPPPGLMGGQKRAKPSALQKTVQEHWATVPEALKTQCQALGG